jgi:hypothetical protein
VLHTLVKSRQIEGKDTFITYIDFSKAFDGINRDMLLYKLLASGIDGKMYFIIKALYTKTCSCINVNGKLTEWFNTLLGVRQGDSLSPTLFNIFINDLAIGIKQLGIGLAVGNEKIPILMYADDIAILAENENDMQSLLNFVHSWCEAWHMKINMTKSKVTHFRKQGTPPSNSEFKLGNAKLEYVEKYKYLGVIFDEFLTFEQHTQAMAESGGSALGAIITKYKKLENMGYDTYTKSFETSICPVINYGSEVWGYIKNSKSDSVQIKGMKVFLGVHRFAANVAVEGDMGWYPNRIKRTLNVLRYWNRIVQMKNDRLTKKVFTYEYALNKRGSWCRFVRNTLTDLDLENIYLSQQPCDLVLCKTKLYENYRKEWSDNLKRKPKLRTYVQIKKNFETEKYVKLNLDKNQRSMLAQLRTGILPLHVETGRFSNKKLEDRKCNICNSGSVENEFHFLFHCSHYNHQRLTFFNELNSNVFENLEDHVKLSHLFVNNARKLSKFVCKIFNIRQEKLYQEAV